MNRYLKKTITVPLGACCALLLAGGGDVNRWEYQANELAKLGASTRGAYDEFGISVSIDGAGAIVGEHKGDGVVPDSGAAHIFRHIGDGWEWEAKLWAANGTANERFGFFVSISGDYAIVGTPRYGVPYGSAFVFERDAEGWGQVAELTAPVPAGGDYFGYSVWISGNYAIVGAYGDSHSGSDSGAAYIFRREGQGWIQKAKLTASDAAFDDQFGLCVAISGDYAIVGAHNDDDNGSNSGSAYIFERAVGGWVDAAETAKLTASDGVAGDSFGGSVAISAEFAIVGASYDDDDGSASGSAYVFERPVGGWVDATETAKLTASDGAAGDWFGRFRGVSITGDYAVVGAYRDDDNGSDSGSVYVFEYDGVGGWDEVGKLLASDGEDSDHFGFSVSASGDTTLIGAPHNDDGGEDSGAAYIYSDGIEPLSIGVGTLRGTVRDMMTGATIADATVSILGQTPVSTLDDGSFEFTDVSPDPVTVEVTVTDYHTASRTVAVGANSTTVVNIAMIPDLELQDPEVVEVRAQFCGPDQHAYYLNGVNGVEETFTAKIDWGTVPVPLRYQVRWELSWDGGSDEPTDSCVDFLPDCSTVTHIFNMGKNFGDGGSMKVVAVADLGAVKSEPYLVNFHVVNPTPAIPADKWVADTSGSTLSYDIIEGSTSAMPVDTDEYALRGTSVPDWIPLLGAEELRLRGGAVVDGTVKADGTIETKLSSPNPDPYPTKIGGATFWSVVSGNWIWQFDESQDDWGVIEKSVNVGIEARVRREFPPVILPPALPVYYEVALGMGAGLGFVTSWDDVGNPDYALTAHVEGWGEGVVGQGLNNIADIEGYLRAGAYFDFRAPFPDTACWKPLERFGVFVKAGARAHWLRWRIWEVSTTWTHDLCGSSRESPFSPLRAWERRGPRLIERDYLAKPYAVFVGNSHLGRTGRGEVTEEQPVQLNVFPQSIPDLAAIDNNLLMVWVHDDPNRSPTNGSEIVFSSYDSAGSSWSEGGGKWVVPEDGVDLAYELNLTTVQPPELDDPKVYYSSFETPDGAPPVQPAADDFRRWDGVPITAVGWWGTEAQGDDGIFRFRFYDDVPAGSDPDPDVTWSHPGNLLLTVDVADWMQVWDGAAGAWYLSATLVSPFAPQVGTVYWLSIAYVHPTYAWECLQSSTQWNDLAVTWAEAPEPVDDDGTADYRPQIATFPLSAYPAGRALLAWENVKEVLIEPGDPGDPCISECSGKPDEEQCRVDCKLRKTKEKTEIAVAEYDGSSGTWAVLDPPLTNNDHLDHSPRIAAASNGTGILTWVSNATGHETGDPDNPNVLRYAVYDSSGWSSANDIVSDIESTIKSAMAYDGSEAVLLFVGDTGELDDPETEFESTADRELYGATYSAGTWTYLNRLTTDQVEDANPQVAYDSNGDLVIVWYSNGDLWMATQSNLSDARVIVDLFGKWAGAADFRLTSSNETGRIALVWQSASQERIEPWQKEVDPDKWTWNPAGAGGAVEEVDGYQRTVLADPGPYRQVRTSVDLMRDEVTVEVKFNPVSIAKDGEIGFYLGETPDNPALLNGFAWHWDRTGTYFRIRHVVGAVEGPPGNWTPTVAWEQEFSGDESGYREYHVYRIEKVNSTYKFYRDGEKLATYQDGFNLPAQLYWTAGYLWNFPTVGKTGELHTNYVLATTGDPPETVFYDDFDDTDVDIWYSVYVPSDTNGGWWSHPLQLTTDAPMERSMAPVYDAAGDLVIAYNKVPIDYRTEEIAIGCDKVIQLQLPEFGQVDLHVLRHTFCHDLALSASDITVDPPNPSPGTTATITATIHNICDAPMTDVEVAFYDGTPASETLIETTTIAEPPDVLVGGDVRTASVTWQVPGTATVPFDIYVEIKDPNCVNPADPACENDKAVLAGVVKPDLYIDSILVQTVGFYSVLTVRVANEGVVQATNVSVVLREDGPDGALLPGATFTIAMPILPGAYQDVVTYLWPGYGPTVCAMVDEDGAIAEFDETNNTRLAAVYHPHGACCHPVGSCYLTPDALTCTGSGGVFEGHGTDCSPNCCAQPVTTGADTCDQAWVHIINVPAPGEDPVTITITGNNQAATFGDSYPDTCEGGTANPDGPCDPMADCAGLGTNAHCVWDAGAAYGFCEEVADPPEDPITCYPHTQCSDGDGYQSDDPDDGTCTAGATCDYGLFSPEGAFRDRGWWEAFAIDACADVRIDLCCTGEISGEIHQPQWDGLISECDPCGGLIPSSIVGSHSVGTDDASSGRGAPFCKSDDPWWTFRSLEAATTYYQHVYGATGGHFGDYQMHITVGACPVAACCQEGGVCKTGTPNAGVECDEDEDCGNPPFDADGDCVGNCEVLNQTECDASGGYWLGFGVIPPDAQPMVACEAGDYHACGVGSCCTGPAVCTDEDPGGAGMTLDYCTSVNGTYVGGAMCDYQLTPCTACEIEGEPNCQIGDFVPVYQNLTSDLTVPPFGVVTADDFIPLSDQISSVCVWGTYLDNSEPSPAGDQGYEQFGCVGNVEGNFRVRVYTDDGGFPGSLVDERWVTGDDVPSSQLPAHIGFSAGYGIPILSHMLVFEPPIALPAASVPYWLEVANNTTHPPGADVTDASVAFDNTCYWHWTQIFRDEGIGNDYSVMGTNDRPEDQGACVGGFCNAGAHEGEECTGQTDCSRGYVPSAGSARSTDLAFCLGAPGGDPLPFDPPPTPVGSCCQCDQSCTVDQDLATCDDDLIGNWFLQNDCATGMCEDQPGVSCLGGASSAVAMAGLDCGGAGGSGGAIKVPPEGGMYAFDTSCAPTDGPYDTRGIQPGQFVHDIWYQYVTNCTGKLVVSMCATGNSDGAYDSVLALYSDRTSECSCPLGRCTQVGEAVNETCNGIADGGAGIDALNSVNPGECWLIRVGGLQQFPGNDAGAGIVDIHCVTTACPTPDPPEPDTLDLVGEPVNQKVRYLSFESTDTTRSSPASLRAIRVHMVDLPAPDYNLWNGTKMYVGEPEEFCENAGQVNPPCAPAQPADTFLAATLECEPYFTDWSELGVIHVYHEGIIPGGYYEVAAVHQQCDLALEASFSEALEVTMSPWGDVVWKCTTCPCTPPEGLVGIPTDVTAILDKFKNLVPPILPCHAITKVRADLDWETPNRRIDISDVTFCLDAFRGDQYPPPAFDDPKPPPCSPGGECAPAAASGQ